MSNFVNTLVVSSIPEEGIVKSDASTLSSAVTIHAAVIRHMCAAYMLR